MRRRRSGFRACRFCGEVVRRVSSNHLPFDARQAHVLRPHVRRTERAGPVGDTFMPLPRGIIVPPQPDSDVTSADNHGNPGMPLRTPTSCRLRRGTLIRHSPGCMTVPTGTAGSVRIGILIEAAGPNRPSVRASLRESDQGPCAAFCVDVPAPGRRRQTVPPAAVGATVASPSRPRQLCSDMPSGRRVFPACS